MWVCTNHLFLLRLSHLREDVNILTSNWDPRYILPLHQQGGVSIKTSFSSKYTSSCSITLAGARGLWDWYKQLCFVSKCFVDSFAMIFPKCFQFYLLVLGALCFLATDWRTGGPANTLYNEQTNRNTKPFQNMKNWLFCSLEFQCIPVVSSIWHIH